MTALTTRTPTSSTAPAAPRRSRQDPALTALRFRAWQSAQGAGLELSRDDLADRLDVAPDLLKRALRGQRWARDLARPQTIDQDETELARRYAGGRVI